MPRNQHEQRQLRLGLVAYRRRPRNEILDDVQKLRSMHKAGLLGGEIMPEDANPNLPADSAENYHYFTLPMALNYQRNSYSLWRSAEETYLDQDTRYAFVPREAAEVGLETLQDALTKHKLAIQPNRHTEIWQRISKTIGSLFDGSVRNLFVQCDWCVPDILHSIQGPHKQGFPYLSGPKISNYWLYVMDRYTDANLTGREYLSVAPDTHVVQASIRLGLVEPEKQDSPRIQSIVSEAWVNILKGTGILPIDIHTPLWLWSRSGFLSLESEQHTPSQGRHQDIL